MRTLFLSITLLLTLQASDCAKAGSIQDESVTQAKRELDAHNLASSTPTPPALVKLPQRPRQAPEVAER